MAEYWNTIQIIILSLLSIAILAQIGAAVLVWLQARKFKKGDGIVHAEVGLMSLLWRHCNVFDIIDCLSMIIFHSLEDHASPAFCAIFGIYMVFIPIVRISHAFIVVTVSIYVSRRQLSGQPITLDGRLLFAPWLIGLLLAATLGTPQLSYADSIQRMGGGHCTHGPFYCFLLPYNVCMYVHIIGEKVIPGIVVLLWAVAILPVQFATKLQPRVIRCEGYRVPFGLLFAFALLATFFLDWAYGARLTGNAIVYIVFALKEKAVGMVEEKKHESAAVSGEAAQQPQKEQLHSHAVFMDKGKGY